MAVGTGAALIGGSILSAGAGIHASNRAASAQNRASRRAINAQNSALERIIGLNAPQTALGHGAVNDLARLFGFGGQAPQAPAGPQFSDRDQRSIAIARALGFDDFGRTSPPQMPGGAQLPGNGTPDMSVFTTSPDFEFRRDQGLQGIAQTLGAGGQGAFSGNALRGLNEFNSNLASGEFGNFVNRRLAMAGLGQNANFQAGNAIGNNATNVGNALFQSGNARASGILGAGASINNGINGILQSLILRDAGLVGGGAGLVGGGIGRGS